MNIKRLELAASKKALGLLDRKAIVLAAVQALEEGVDSPSLRVLAGLAPGEFGEAQVLLDKVLAELTLTVPAKRPAVMALAREIAQRILAGRTSSYDGAREIWDLSLQAPDESFPELDPFVYAASEWPDRPEFRRELQKGIDAAARELLVDSRER